MDEKCAAGLRTKIRTLPLYLCGVVHLPERIQQPLIAKLQRIECDLYHLCMTGLVRADIFVSWILRVTAAIANRGVDHSRNIAERRFDPPKTSCSKCRCFVHGRLLLSAPFY